MYSVGITDDIISNARTYAYELEKNLKAKPNYTGLVAPDRYYYGYLGELLFKVLLERENKQFLYHVKTNGESDDGEFTLYPVVGPKIIVDIKTATQHYHRNIMMPQKQNNNSDYYVGVRINKYVGEIWGFCKKEELDLSKEGFGEYSVPTLYKKLNELHPIGELLGAIL